MSYNSTKVIIESKNKASTFKIGSIGPIGWGALKLYPR